MTHTKSPADTSKIGSSANFISAATEHTVESLAARIRAACDAMSDEMTWDTPAHLIHQLVERESLEGTIAAVGFDEGVARLAQHFIDSYEKTSSGYFGSVRLTSTNDLEHVTDDGIHLTPETLLALHETPLKDFGFYEMLLEDKRAAKQAA